MKALIPFKSKLFKPCTKFVSIFTFKLKRPLFIPALRARRIIRTPSPPHSQLTIPPTIKKRSPASAIRFIFRYLKPSCRNMDKLAEAEAEVRSISEAADRERLLFSSPLTPANYIKVGLGDFRKRGSSDVVEDACRTFENYLAEMIVEEGKVSDLMDVEELLYCWKNLTSPIFIDLVSRFYGELCTDLFSGNIHPNDADTPKSRPY